MEDIKAGLKNKNSYTFDDLCDIMALLRSPQGCVWDREQDHKSIRKNFIEEAYEVCEAIDEENAVHLCEELGDVMLQVVFHTQMEKEKGSFDINDVVSGICKKLIFRHPHVFGELSINTPEGVSDNWDAIKKIEKGQKNVGDVLESVPKTLPSLMRAQKINKKAEKNGLVLCEDDAGLDALDKAEYAEILMKICKSANKKGIDLEELLEQKCTDEIKNIKKI
ncbi:MAG: MazG family protein [Clostridia bacterium]|nr:MazG family protein [Clostridia bacterium]